MTPTPSPCMPQGVFAQHGTALAARGKAAIGRVFAQLLADRPDANWDLKTQLYDVRRAEEWT